MLARSITDFSTPFHAVRWLNYKFPTFLSSLLHLVINFRHVFGETISCGLVTMRH